jgi:hypothetical protein
VAIGVTAVLRVGTTLVALISTYGVAFPHIVAHQPSVLADVWQHWDAPFYISLAQHGYPSAHAAGAPPGSIPGLAAFGPAYPALVALVHTVTRMGWAWAAQFTSAVATVIAIAGLVVLADRDQGMATANISVTLLVAFPTSFFLLAGYPESLALAFLVWSFIAVRRGRWILAGLALAGAAATNFYLGIALVALVVEFAESRPGGIGWPRRGMRDVVGPAALVVPAAIFFTIWMVVCDHLYGTPLAFVRVQANWNRHFAFPWTLAHRTLGDLVHWRFLDTNVASFMELFDTVTVVLLAITTVYVFVRVRRSYGVLLGVALCVYTFQTILYSETREVLVLFPFFMGLAGWVSGHPWRERFVLACFLPSAYFLVERFVNHRFAG